MRIAIDAFNLAGDRRGMGRIVRRNISALRAIGEAELALVARDAAKAAELREEFALPAMTPKALRGERFDAVWYPWNGMRFAPHAPSIVTINDPFAFTFAHSNLVARWREQSPIRRAIHNADRLFTISQWGAAELQRLFGVDPGRITVSTPAVDPFWRPAQAPGLAPYVLFVAGPEARKNAAFLFSAFDAAFGEAPSPALVVAGTLNDADERRLASMRAVHLRERPLDERLRELYSGALAVAVPSLAEGFGMPAVEAMACGAAVLAANATALPEACGGAALLLPPGDLDAWKAALIRVCGDADLRAQLRESGMQRAARIDPDGPAKDLLARARRFREGVR